MVRNCNFERIFVSVDLVLCDVVGTCEQVLAIAGDALRGLAEEKDTIRGGNIKLETLKEWGVREREREREIEIIRREKYLELSHNGTACYSVAMLTSFTHNYYEFPPHFLLNTYSLTYLPAIC